MKSAHRSSGHRKRLVILNEYVGDTGQCKITMNICLCEVTADVVDKAEAANTAPPAAPINQSLGAALSRSGFRWWCAARRIPGRSVGEPTNSIPAASRAAFTSSSVDERLGGTSSTASKRLIVLAVTPAVLASCSVVQRRAFRAERICVPVGCGD